MFIQKVVEMKTESKENSKLDEAANAQDENTFSIEKVDSSKIFSSELDFPCWSIATFEGVAARGLSYEKALKRIKRLNKKGISGLCIVTDEAAKRISKKKI